MTNEKSTAIIHRTIAKQRREKLAEELNKVHISRLKNQKVITSVTPSMKKSTTHTAVASQTKESTVIQSKPASFTQLSSVSKPFISATTATTATTVTTLKTNTPTLVPSSNPTSRPISVPSFRSAKELKNEAISKALGLTDDGTVNKNLSDLYKTATSNKRNAAKKSRSFFRTRRFAVALSCALAAVFTLGYFVNLNLPNIPARVAAMQAGFSVRYPAYIPQNYSLTSITSDKESKITIHLSDGKQRIVIKEERSTWDSQALLHNFVKKTWGNNFATTRDQGLTVYFSGSNAAWVNGGILYKIEANSDVNRLQLHNIIYSL